MKFPLHFAFINSINSDLSSRLNNSALRDKKSDLKINFVTEEASNLAMADLLLSALVPIVVQKSGDLLAQRISEMWGMVDLRKRLEDKLLEVHDVLTDAEEHGNTKPSVRSWLAKLKSAANDADDILDKYRRQDAVRLGYKIGNVSGFFSFENPVMFRFKMSRKLKMVLERIDELVTQKEVVRVRTPLTHKKNRKRKRSEQGCNKKGKLEVGWPGLKKKKKEGVLF